MKNYSVFEQTEEIMAKVRNVMQELKEICIANDIPMFVSVCNKGDAQTTEYVRDAVFPETVGLILKDDQIAKHANVALGFNTVYRDDDDTVEMPAVKRLCACDADEFACDA